MKLRLAMEEYQHLQMHLNLRSDFTGSFARVSNTISSGRSWFVLRCRVGGCASHFDHGLSTIQIRVLNT